MVLADNTVRKNTLKTMSGSGRAMFPVGCRSLSWNWMGNEYELPADEAGSMMSKHYHAVVIGDIKHRNTLPLRLWCFLLVLKPNEKFANTNNSALPHASKCLQNSYSSNCLYELLHCFRDFSCSSTISFVSFLFVNFPLRSMPQIKPTTRQFISACARRSRESGWWQFDNLYSVVNLLFNVCKKYR